MSTLMTFIGKGESATQAGADPYLRTRYTFPDQTTSITTFFGEALASHVRPEKLIIIGTATSTWRALALDLADDLELATALEGTEKSGIVASQLTSLELILSRVLNATVICRVIDEHDHLGTIAVLYRLLPIQGQMCLDLTHGYRFMPMLALAAVQVQDGFHPGRLRQTHLWYGQLQPRATQSAREAKTGEPIGTGTGIRLNGLERALALAHGAAAFTRSLDPEPLIAALGSVPKPLHDALDRLSEALLTHAFTVLTTVPQQIITHLQKWEGDPDGILADEVRRVLTPLATGTLGQRLIALARWASECGHHALAALAAYEGLTRLATCDTATTDADHAVDAFLAGKDPATRDACDRLRRARNRVAHGGETARSSDLPVAATVRNVLPILTRLIP